MMIRFAALALFVATDVRAQVTIPRFAGAIPAGERRFIEGMNYDPSDAPLRWLPNGDLLVMHIEQYNSADVYASSCKGSGVFVVPSSGQGAARALAINVPACESGNELKDATVDPSGKLLAFSVRVAHKSQRVSLDMTTGRLDTSRSQRAGPNEVRSTYSRGWGPTREGGTVGPLVWSPDGRQIAFVRSYDRGDTIWALDLDSGRIRQITETAR